MKCLAIGDIHTKTWILSEILELVDLYDHIVFCGDYADNWNTSPVQSIAAWTQLHQMMIENPNKIHAVIGNHDYAYIHSEIAGNSSGFNGVTFTAINSPEKKWLKDWLLSLPVTLEIDGVTFSHAGITNEWDGDMSVQGLWNDTSPIWARPADFGGRITYKKIPQVIGHNASEKIWNPEENIWCIDTFSQKPDGTYFGDQTVLEIIDGQEFNILELRKLLGEGNDNTSSVQTQVS